MYAAVTILSPLGPDGRPAGGAAREADTRGHDAGGHANAARDARGREAAGHGDAPGVLVVPRGAIVDTGLRSVAFVEIGPGRYEAREVVAGPLSGEYRVIIEGLEEGETIVARGAFLIDSRARITGQADAVYGGALGRGDDETGRGAHGGH